MVIFSPPENAPTFRYGGFNGLPPIFISAVAPVSTVSESNENLGLTPPANRTNDIIEAIKDIREEVKEIEESPKARIPALM